MQKIVVNRCYGGFSLSEEALKRLGWDESKHLDAMVREHRSDPDLVACVEALGPRASGEGAALTVVSIPDDVEWQIDEYAGSEWVAEKHRTW